MSRTMADALYVQNMQGLHVDMAAWYPHDPRNTAGEPKGFPQVIRIDNGGWHTDCHVMDATDAPYTVLDAPRWVTACDMPQPTVYASLSAVPMLLSAMQRSARQWYLWVADWDDDISRPPVPPLYGRVTLIGWQYRPVGPYDLSIIADDAWYPLPQKGGSMAVSAQTGWKVCDKCLGPVYAPSGNDAGVCPAGGQHHVGNSDTYVFLTDNP